MKKSVQKDRSNEIQRRIFEIIDSMHEIEIRKLLIGLEKWQQTNNNSRRKYPRKNISIYALFKTNGLSFREYIKNLSASGLYIETGIPISNNNELFMQFIHPESKHLIKIKGEIVRTDPNGIGVKFDEPDPRIV